MDGHPSGYLRTRERAEFFGRRLSLDGKPVRYVGSEAAVKAMKRAGASAAPATAGRLARGRH